jgi:hypothetical protein
MQLYFKLENTIDWNKSIEKQLNNLSKYDNITNEEIQELARTCHKSAEAGILIEYLGFEKLKPYLPLFLKFLQDMNWPAARGAANMLLRSGKEIISELKRVFKEVDDDALWHDWILTGIVQNFNHGLILELREDLITLIRRADTEGASIKALRILKENKLLTAEEVKFHYQFLLERYTGNQYWITELNDEIKPDAII